MSFLDTIKGMGSGLSPNSLSPDSFINNPFITKLAFFGKIAFYLGVFFFGGVLLWKFYLQYKIRVTIKKEIGGGGVDVVRDMARMIIDEQGKEKLAFYKTRKGKEPITCPLPPAKYKGKIGKKDYYEFWLDDNNQVHPIDTDNSDKEHVHLRIQPQERRAWARMEDRLLNEKYSKKDWLEKYLPSMVVISAFIIAFLIFFFMSKDLAAGLSEVARTMNQVASSCVSIKG